MANLALPGSVTYSDTDYTLTSIGAYAFYLSGVTDVALPASVSDVDDRAFRSSDVANVAVADDNPSFSSYDGVLYDATRSSLLLIPGGRQGAVRISDKAEEVDASAFSHCAGVDAISVDADSAYLSSWEGLLYDADGTTLLRVPAGATEITIREGCATIAAGALEACASLTTINAPASVTSISPDVFTAIPTISLLAASLTGAGDPGTAGEPSSQEAAPQLTAMVALSTADDSLPKVDPSTITVNLPEEVDDSLWAKLGCSFGGDATSSKETQDPELIISQMVSLSDGAVAYAEYNDTAVSSQKVTNATLQISSWPKLYVKTPANIAYGLYSGTVSWTSSAATPQDDDIVTLRVTKFVPHTAASGGTGADYSYSTVMTRFTELSGGYAPRYITAQSTGSECAVDALYGATTSSPCILKFKGRDIHTRGNWPEFRVSHEYASTQYSPWNNITFDKNTEDSVNYNGHKGNVWVSPITYLRTPALTRSGYKHLGWSKSETAITASYGPDQLLEVPFSESTTLFAVWIKNPISGVRVFDTYGWGGSGGVFLWTGKGYYENSNPNDSSVMLSAVLKPERFGYVFQGYYTASTGGSLVIPASCSLDGLSNTRFTANTTLYAHWDQPPYVISFYNNAGDKLIGTKNMTYGIVDTLLAGNDTRVKSAVPSGHAAAGWAIAANQATRNYAMGQSGSMFYTAASGAVSLYLVLDPVYTITLKTNAIDTTTDYKKVYLWYGKGWYDTETPDDATKVMSTIGTPERIGYTYKGFSGSSNAASGTYWTEVTRFPSATAFGKDTTLFAVWEGRLAKVTLNDDGGTGGMGAVYVRYGDAWYADEGCKNSITKVSKPVRDGYVFDGYTWNGQDVRRINKEGVIVTGTESFTSAVTFTAQWKAATAHFDGGGGTLELKRNVSGGAIETVESGLRSYDARWLTSSPSAVSARLAGWWQEADGKRYNYSIWPTRNGYALTGWKVMAPDGTESVIDASMGDVPLVVGATYVAQWVPAIRADAPISATVRLDVLGVEDQAMDEEEPGYLESRCGEPLKVAEVSFEKKPGATDLFGAHVPDIELQALPGKDASWATDAPAFSFALDAAGDAATEDDATKLAPLSMSGYEVRIPISYRFLIPDALLDEVLGAIDPATFEDKKTPVCSVVYTVALANPES